MNEESFSDSVATIQDLKDVVERFAQERDWERYHTPKNLAGSVAIEAAELLERFQWLTPEESLDLKNDPDQKKAVAEEIADVLSYLLNLCLKLDVDLAKEFVEKFHKNALKYPVGKNCPARVESSRTR